MQLKHKIKSLIKANTITRNLYRKFAYTHANYKEIKAAIHPILKAKRRNPNAIFLVLTPEHGNLGDQAIAVAEHKMLANINIPYIEITDKQFHLLSRHNSTNVLNGRTVLVHGGGNMGTLWFSAEKALREIIVRNTDSSILCLPNTIFYEDSDWGRQELQNSISIYNAHPSLKMYAREKTSYAFMEPIYNEVQLIPDMVLSLEAYDAGLERKGCLLCLRADCEKTRTDEAEQIVLEQVKSLFGDDVAYTDMVVDHGITPAQRNAEVEAKFREFGGAELVITDRLHGMIFCAITGTPCIVINSKSHKVLGCYQWIKHLDYIKICEDPAQIEELYREIPKTPHVYTNEHLAEYYDKLKADIMQAAGR